MVPPTGDQAMRRGRVEPRMLRNDGTGQRVVDVAVAAEDRGITRGAQQVVVIRSAVDADEARAYEIGEIAIA